MTSAMSPSKKPWTYGGGGPLPLERAPMTKSFAPQVLCARRGVALGIEADDCRSSRLQDPGPRGSWRRDQMQAVAGAVKPRVNRCPILWHRLLHGLSGNWLAAAIEPQHQPVAQGKTRVHPRLCG